MIKLEVFHTELPVLNIGSRSPRGGGSSLANNLAMDEYLSALAAKGAKLGECRSLRTFLTTNLAATETGKFWDSQVAKKGFLSKKKGDRSKLQRRFCVVKYVTLYYFKNEGDMNPAGSIRLDLAEISSIVEADGKAGFTLTGGKSDGSRSFLCDTQRESDLWISEIEAVKAAHDKAIAVHGSLEVRVSEGRSLLAQNIFVQTVADSQQHYTNVVPKSAGNPTWSGGAVKFDIRSNRKFLYCVIYDQPALSSSLPTCLGEVTIPLNALAGGKTLAGRFKLDAWMPLCPQKFLQSATGEIHVHLDYNFVPDQTVLMVQKRIIALYHETVLAVIKYFRANPTGMELEGLFRVPGRMLNMQKMWDGVVKSGPSLDLLQGESFEDVGGLLKMCLRNTPVPIFPFEVFDRVTNLDPEDKHFFANISEIIQSGLSDSAQTVLRELLSFLALVATHRGLNKMSHPNLSVVFGPALIREEEDSLEMLIYLPKINKLVCKLIGNVEKIQYSDTL